MADAEAIKMAVTQVALEARKAEMLAMTEAKKESGMPTSCDMQAKSGKATKTKQEDQPPDNQSSSGLPNTNILN